MISGILRSPAGFELKSLDENNLRCVGTGKVYEVKCGNAFLFDEADVSPFLREEADSHNAVVAWHLAPNLDENPHERVYATAKKINTEWMFSSLSYERPEARHVVELGSWRGELICRFADMDFDAYALDFFHGMIDAAAARHTGKRYTRITAPMANLPLADGSVDLLYMHATLHHALPRSHSNFEWCNPRNLHDALREIKRVLKPDGAFFLMGEGVYPEGMAIADRFYEKEAAAKTRAYESWYTMSEYERAFRDVGVYPTLMSNQTNNVLDLHTYYGGQKIQLVKTSDGITEHNYSELTEVAAKNTGRLWQHRHLPNWINLRQEVSLKRVTFVQRAKKMLWG